MRTNFIFVIGGVLSGLGKGITTASIGKLLQLHGCKVSAIKIDPYLNIDAGTMRPTEHGEVWVTEDGGEIDQDLGNYERFLNINLYKYHNITSGKVYLSVINDERKGKYLGKTVQPIPHVTDKIKEMILNVAKKDKTDFILIEIGGQVGDYENIMFLEAARQMKMKHPVMFVHIGYLPVPPHLGEMKTKPIQHSIHALRGIGIIPDIIIGRSVKSMDNERKKKIALACGVKEERVFSNPNIENIYEVPLVLSKQGIDKIILDFFKINAKTNKVNNWSKFISEIKNIKKTVNIGIVGKYFDIGDFNLIDSYISVIEAVKHAAWNNNVNHNIIWIDSKEFEDNLENVEKLNEMDCIIVPGGFGSSGVEGKILAIKFCRENNIPYLGLCLGLQLAVVEFARNVCGMQGAHTTEIFPKTPYPVIDIIDYQKAIMENSDYGATMRLGSWKATLSKNSKVYKLYSNNANISERHRHRYEVNPKYINKIENHGMIFSGRSTDGMLMEFLELPSHNYFIATQSHPEFKSRPMKPAPLFDGLIKAAIKSSS